jgi:hypothetical protein
MERWPPGMEGSCGQTARVILQLGGWAWVYESFTIMIRHVTKMLQETQTEMDSLDK